MRRLEQVKKESVAAKINIYLYIAGLMSDAETARKHNNAAMANEILSLAKEIILDLASDQHDQMLKGSV